MEINDEFSDHLQKLVQLLDIPCNDPSIFLSACIHSSYQNEFRLKALSDNERLEFLGDSALSLIVSEFLYKTFPAFSEGQLSSSKAKIIDAASCRGYAEMLGLEPFLLLGKGEKQNVGKGRESVIADFFEAIVGAIYLDQGIEVLKAFLFSKFANKWIELIESREDNYKVILQEQVQKLYQKIPAYQIVSEEGPDHNKVFIVAVYIEEKKLSEGSGSSKKEAQQNAAKAALEVLKKGEI